MPYFYWTGVEITGEKRKGKLFARSEQHLDMLLFKRHIALLFSKQARQLIKKPIRTKHVAQFFRQLSVLIDAGVLLPDALAIVGDQIEHVPLQEIVHALAAQVCEGVSLSNAMQAYPHVFNHIMVQLVKAGEESGELSEALEGICAHISIAQEFYERVRSALLLPVITLIFFGIIAIIIFTVIMPRFVDIFALLNQDIPPTTRALLSISAFMGSSAMVAVMGFMTVMGLVVWRVTRSGYGKHVCDIVVIHVPVVGFLLQQRFLAYTFQTLALLIEGGMPVVSALGVIRNSISNHVFQRYLHRLEMDVAAGNSLSDAMARHMDSLFSPDVIAMVEVGQESGRLGVLLKKVAAMYHERIARKLTLITVLLQPTIMIILGLLVTLLIFSVYGPIFNMSSAF